MTTTLTTLEQRETTASTSHTLIRLVGRYWNALSERRKRRRQIAELRALGTGALKDIGIDPSEVSSVVHGAGRDASRTRR
jgi:uncharacterized protein YjiS (DUF1127 family)